MPLLSIPNIMSLLSFCLKRIFFTLQGKYYQLVKGAAIGSPPKSSHSQPLYEGLQKLDSKLITQPTKDLAQVCQWNFCSQSRMHTTVSHPSKILGSQHTVHHRIFIPIRLSSLSWHPNITRTRWHPHHHSLQESNTYISISTLGQSPQQHQQVQHLQHSLTQGPVCLFEPTIIQIGNQHIHTAPWRWNYPDWVFHRLQAKLEFQLSQNQRHNKKKSHRNNNRNNIFVVVPYSKDLSESFRNICSKAGVQTHSKRTCGSNQDRSQHHPKRVGHLQVQIWSTQFQHGIHRGNRQKFWWKIQRTSQGPLSHLWSLPNNGT